MKNKRCLSGRLSTKGFTLIELLVVVLIIGVLAAVALPQYKKAVYKSRFAKLELLANEYTQAAQAYHLATGAWPSEFDELAISPTGTVATPTGNDCRKVNDMFCCLSATIAGNQSAGITCGLEDQTLFYSEKFAGLDRFCYAKVGDSVANNVCAGRGTFLGNGGNGGHNTITPNGHYTGASEYYITQ